MACIRLWPLMGLSMYIVCRQGTSKPVSHMSRTITSCNSSSGSLKRRANRSRAALFRTCGCHSGGSDAEPVITTLILPFASSSLCQSGRKRVMASYMATQMRRLMHTIIALPKSASWRRSKCSTRSSATSRIRFSAPTSASSEAHLLRSRCLPASSSSVSVISSNSSSKLGFSASLSSILASRLS